jgi:septal ring factor EnvC (AmiA/AmiB activator)
MTSPASTTSASVYSTVVANARLLARETLRTRNIHKWVRENASIESRKNDYLKGIEDKKELVKNAELSVARVEYKISQLDTANPDFDTLKKNLEANLKEENDMLDIYVAEVTRYTEDVAKANLKLDEQIAENKAKIGRWEDGTNKVQLENLNDLAHEYIELFYKEKAKTLDTDGTVVPLKSSF